MARIIAAFSQFFDGEGNPLVNGKLRFLESSTNNTDKGTYADSNESIPNTNPVLLDAEGRCPNVFGSGDYRVILYDSDDVQIQMFDPVGTSLGMIPYSDWNGYILYDTGFVVKGQDGNYYISENDNNVGNNPITDSGENWTQLPVIGFYNEYKTYSQFDVVLLTSGYTAISKTDDNIGNDPLTDRDNWKLPYIEEYIIAVDGGVDAPNTYVAIDNSSVSFVRVLPTNPSDRDFVQYKHIGTVLDGNTVVINRNGNTIMGLTEDMQFDVDNATIRLTYFADTYDWRI